MDEENSYVHKISMWAKQPKNYRWLVPLLSFLLLLFLIKGCFSKDTKNDEIFYIARDSLWYPQNFYGREKSVLAFSDDLIYEVAKLKKLQIRLVSSNPGDLLSMLNRDPRIDGIFSTLIPTLALQERYTFSEPYFELGTVLVVAQESPFNTLNDMEGKFLGMRRGSAALYNIPNPPRVSIYPYDSMITMMDDIIRNRIDGALMSQLNAANLTSAYYKGKVRIATLPLTNEGLRLVTHNTPKDKFLIQSFNDALKELKADGTYQKLIQKWDLISI